ncbi:MAG: ATP-binding protein, partial [Planctomycetota bacterium]
VPGRIRIVVSDSGEGLTREVLARVFEPFFTTKPKGSGSGLGLPIVRSIVSEHGGTVAIDSQRGRGTTVSIDLPLCDALPTPPRQPAPVSTLRIIVAVTRPYPRQVIASTLRDIVVDVLEVRDATALASSLAGQGASLGGVVVEASLAQGPTYPSLLAAAQSGVPVVVLCSPDQHPGEISAHATVLNEPYTMAQLAEQVRRALELRSGPAKAAPGGATIVAS